MCIRDSVTTVLAAYAFACLNFPGKKLMLSLMLATLMIPGEMLIITNFITITKLKWINTYQAMIVPYLASVFYIYLLTQFFSQVPDALYLAAKVDKCNDFKYLIKIMIPINKSPITTVCILNAIGCWNSFMSVSYTHLCKRNLRSLVRRRNHCTEGLS